MSVEEANALTNLISLCHRCHLNKIEPLVSSMIKLKTAWPEIVRKQEEFIVNGKPKTA